MGSKIAVLNSRAEQEALAPKAENEAWIGLHKDPRNNSRWQWVDGSSLNYTNWSKGEPNSNSSTGDCTKIYPASSALAGKWKDEKCNLPLNFICEINGTLGNIML